MSLIVPEKFPDSIDKAVSNLTEKPTKAVGTTFGDIWFLVFGGFSQLADKRRVKYQVALEEYERECREKIEAIPEDKRIEPDVQVAAAALEASKYCVENEEVRKMFANLIASTMNADTSNTAHPSFSEILKQMTAFDATVLQLFLYNSSYPIVRYKIVDGDNNYQIYYTNVFIYGLTDITDTDIEKRAVSISSLERAGVIEVKYETFLANDSLYEKFYTTPMYHEATMRAEALNDKLEIQKGVAKITPLGEQLLSVCCPQNIVPITDLNPSIWE